MGDMVQAIEVMSTPPLKKLIRKKDRQAGMAFTVYPYINGRERGFCVSDERGKEDSRAVVFSENRNSDSLCIFLGKPFVFPHEKDAPKDAFIMDKSADYVILTEEIYNKHSYYVWCNTPKLFKMVGEAIAAYLSGEYTEPEFGKQIAVIEKAARKHLGY